jgi:ubiquinone/menaquinone biosynthesis C-methylase UbiE
VLSTDANRGSIERMKEIRERYTGSEASRYEEKRNKSQVWKAEQAAIEKLVERGPVLDVPIGTGRYLPIYERKGIWPHGLDVSLDMIAEARKKRPNLEYKQGSILDIPHADQSFGTAVCTRLLNWLEPAEMQRAIAELFRVAHDVVFSIRIGKEVQHTTITHDERKLIDALSDAGAWVVERLHLRDEKDAGQYYAYKCRRPTWQDVVDQFRWNRNSLQVLSDEWCERYGVPGVTMQDRPVACRWLTGKEIWAEVLKMSEAEPRLTPEGSVSVMSPPRRDSLPITWLDFGDKFGQVDGRHRAYKWRNSNQRYPVFVVGMC